MLIILILLFGMMACQESPEQNAGQAFDSLVYATAICLLFIGGSLAGRITGYWQTGISNNEYLFHVQNLDMPFYNHNRGEVPAYNKDAWLKMMKKIKIVNI